MKRVHLVKLWLLIITCCPGLAACASDTSYLAPTTTPVSAVGPGLSGTRGPVVFFARDEDLWRATADGEHLELYQRKSEDDGEEDNREC